MDNTLKLYHVTREKSLRTLQHNDFVTCVDFNPVDNGCACFESIFGMTNLYVFLFRYCVSGCLDKKVRIWNVKDASIVYRVDIGICNLPKEFLFFMFCLLLR
jgi:WD40 repeat protein